MAEYKKIKRLGAGSFGEVWLVYDLALGIERAVKFVSPSNITDPTNFYNEPQALMTLSHENIVRVEDAGKTTDGRLYIAMEYLPLGSVEDIHKGAHLPLTEAICIIKDVCWALEYAHTSGYIHRDIKPANLLMTNNNTAKLSDFGLATRVPRGGFASPFGYLTHLSPEVISTGNTSKSSDIYALGVTAYRLINGDGFLPDATEHDDIEDLILCGQYPDRTHYRAFVPTNLKKIINKSLAMSPDNRYTSAYEFRKALESFEIQCDWRIVRQGRNHTYKTNIGNTKIEVNVIELGNNHFDIITTKKVGEGQKRRINSDCYNNITRKELKKKIRQILPRYVRDGK